MAKNSRGTFIAPQDRLLWPSFRRVTTSGSPMAQGREEIYDFPVPISFLRIQAFPKVSWPWCGWPAHFQRTITFLECSCDYNLGLALSFLHPLPAKSPPLSTPLTLCFCSSPSLTQSCRSFIIFPKASAPLKQQSSNKFSHSSSLYFSKT